MRAELWKFVKAGEWFIYANTLVGVKKAVVTEIDVKVYEYIPTLVVAYPYGKTADTGVVKIRYDDVEVIEELKNLIAYSLIDYTTLTKAYNAWIKYKTYAEAYEEAFNAAIRELVAL